VDLDDYYLAGVFETVLDHHRPYVKSIGCDPEHYVNSGFLVMNLKLLRHDEMVAQFLMAAKSGRYEFPDQDILNIHCQGKIYGLPPYYNSLNVFFPISHEPLFLSKYTREDLLAVHQYGTIHYTGNKPWQHYTVEQAAWWKCYQTLPAVIKREWKKDGKCWKAYWIYRICNSFAGRNIIKVLKILKKRV
jgi:lipopolysaccharide biosynthesis glycosyltransferase